jgi:hypothetical protein
MKEPSVQSSTKIILAISERAHEGAPPELL